MTEYELGQLPWSLSTIDGMLGKTDKDTLSAEIEKHGVSIVDSDSNNA